MCSVKAIKTAKIGYIVMSSVLCTLGILLMLLGAVMIFKTDYAVAFVGMVLGVYILISRIMIRQDKV